MALYQRDDSARVLHCVRLYLHLLAHQGAESREDGLEPYTRTEGSTKGNFLGNHRLLA